MNIISKIKTLLNDAYFLDGNFLDLRVYRANIFMHLMVAAKTQNKIAYGMDTWQGLESPTKKDLCISNYFLHNKGAYAVKKQELQDHLTKQMPEFPFTLVDTIPEGRFSFVILDKILYEPTKIALENLWDKLSYGATIFISEYQNAGFSADLAITEFLKERAGSVIVNRQLIVEGFKEAFLIIKCFNEKNKPLNWNNISKGTSKPLAVAMVLKTGGKVYNTDYVNALAAGIRRNTTRDVELVCITDENPKKLNVDTVVPFRHDYQRWWGKIELFRPDLFEGKDVFYADLDTIIVGNIDEILDFRFNFCGLRDFYKMTSLGSGLMAWNPSVMHKVYTEFAKRDYVITSSYPEGDQQWIEQYRPRTIFFQDVFPKEVISFKKDCLQQDNSVIVPHGAKIICFHGNPRPHTIEDSSIRDHWKPS